MLSMRDKVQSFREDALEHYISSVSEDFEIDSSGKLSIEKATAVEQNNSNPVTSEAVYEAIDNIEIPEVTQTETLTIEEINLLLGW